MKDNKSFSIIGGDKRMLWTADALLKDGYSVCVCGFDGIDEDLNCEKKELVNAITSSSIIILPLPLTKDFKTLNAPYSKEVIHLNDDFAKLMENKKVFCSMKNKLLSSSVLWNDVFLYDYFMREELNVLNSVATAEGAIEIAFKEFEGTINGSRCLISGFGRIGKVLASMLKGLGAKVVVSARKKEDLAWIEILGYEPCQNNMINKLKNIDLIFNTVPYLIFNAPTIAKIGKPYLIIDLASKPGGVDFEYTKKTGINTIHALSLPGKVAPKTSGEIIKNTIFNMLKEGEYDG